MDMYEDFGCICPTGCTCEDPLPGEEDEDDNRAFRPAEDCPLHNLVPKPAEGCPRHDRERLNCLAQERLEEAEKKFRQELGLQMELPILPHHIF